jgi:hypothetical protein
MKAGMNEVVRLEESPCQLPGVSALGLGAGSSAVASVVVADPGCLHEKKYRPHWPESDLWACSS